MKDSIFEQLSNGAEVFKSDWLIIKNYKVSSQLVVLHEVQTIEKHFFEIRYLSIKTSSILLNSDYYNFAQFCDTGLSLDP